MSARITEHVQQPMLFGWRRRQLLRTGDVRPPRRAACVPGGAANAARHLYPLTTGAAEATARAAAHAAPAVSALRARVAAHLLSALARWQSLLV
jgi:hypothetical protein